MLNILLLCLFMTVYASILIEEDPDIKRNMIEIVESRFFQILFHIHMHDIFQKVFGVHIYIWLSFDEVNWRISDASS